VNDSEPTLQDKDQAVRLTGNEGRGLTERRRAVGDSTTVGNRPADLDAGLVSMAFIWAAIRRSAWFWCATALIGFLIGCGLYVAFPPTYQASTSLLIAFGPNEDHATATSDDQALAQSRAVAGLALHKLRLQQSVASFLAAYTVTVIPNRVLVITVTAPSGADALKWAGAVATSFLRFRAGQLETGQALLLSALDQEASQARRHIASIDQQIRRLSASSSPAPQATLSTLLSERSQASTNLAALDGAITTNQTVVRAQTMSAIAGSRVLDGAALMPRRRLKHLLIYPVAGLILGLALGVGIVVVRAVVSDRLRLREDIARALGAPVRLSIGKMPPGRRLRGRSRLGATTSAGIQRIVAYLRSTVPAPAGDTAALAVVPVDDPQIAALSLVSLAESCAQQGRQVILADLCSGGPAAALLGVKDPGVRAVRVRAGHLVVALPDSDDPAPVGPLYSRTRSPALGHPLGQDEPSPFTEAVAAAYGSADLLLTLIALDPSIGGEHLAAWAETAVVMVTAGRSSATRIHAVGEMIRLAGIPLVSAVLIGADKTDESLGAATRPGTGRGSEVLEGLASP
jgi:capsular polysaccharide biosynthesis protein